MPFNDISYLELWRPVCSAEGNHLCNFGRGYYERKFCEIILNLYHLFRRRCLLMIFHIWKSVGLYVPWSRTISAILVEGIKRYNSEKLF